MILCTVRQSFPCQLLFQCWGPLQKQLSAREHEKHSRLPLFSVLVWFAYKVSGFMCSASACENCWSIEGWIHSQRRNRIDQKLVEKLVHTHTNLVLRESLDDVLRDLLPWDIELVIDEPVDEKEEEPEV